MQQQRNIKWPRKPILAVQWYDESGIKRMVLLDVKVMRLIYPHSKQAKNVYGLRSKKTIDWRRWNRKWRFICLASDSDEIYLFRFLMRNLICSKSGRIIRLWRSFHFRPDWGMYTDSSAIAKNYKLIFLGYLRWKLSSRRLLRDKRGVALANLSDHVWNGSW